MMKFLEEVIFRKAGKRFLYHDDGVNMLGEKYANDSNNMMVGGYYATSCIMLWWKFDMIS